MRLSPTLQHTTARLLAVVLPVVMLAATLAGLHGYRVGDGNPAMEEIANAGRVVNGERVADDVVQHMEVALDVVAPEVLVLGNSTAHTNVDPDALAEGLGVDPERVLTLSQPNSVASHWYAVLANRVFARGHRPSLVVVVGSLRSALLSEPYSEVSRQALLVHLEGREPVVDEHVQRSLRQVEHLRWQKLQLRTRLLTSIRDVAVGLVFDVPHADGAMGRVFHHSNLLSSGATGAWRAEAAADLPDSLAAAAGLPAPHASLLSELAELAGQHGATVVLVRPPMAPRTPLDRRDVTVAGVPEQVQALLEARGHGFADLGDVWLPGTAYSNLTHMSPAGATRFTREALVPAVKAYWPPADRTSAGL